MFTHLHVHSYYSFLRGISSPKALVQKAASQGMTSLALTDYNHLSGIVEFYQACQETNINPILGLETTFQIPGHPTLGGNLVLLAQNFTGWQNLCRLSSQATIQQVEHHENLSSIESLEIHSDGMICLTGGSSGWITSIIKHLDYATADKYLAALKDIFPDRLYVELQIQRSLEHNLTDMCSQLAHQNNLPIVATQNIHYIDPTQKGLYTTLDAIRTNTRRDVIASRNPDADYFCAAKEMKIKFNKYVGAFETTEEIASQCNLKLPLGIHHYPQLHFATGESPENVIRDKSYAGARKLYGVLTENIKNRLEYELEIINDLDFSQSFLIAEEILSFARKEGIQYSSRGSAASSLVAHCLGITSPDPIKLNLYFERFLNPARTTPPDIDTDLCSRRRDEVLRHVFQKYGNDHVAMVGTINRFRQKSALGEVGKAYGLSPSEIRSLAANLPRHYYHSNSNAKDPYKDIKSTGNKSYEEIFEQAEQLIGIPDHISVHPGGIIITPGPITDLIPITISAPSGMIITQLDLDGLEAFGLLKLDLLGIRGLTVIGDVASAIQGWRSKDYPTPQAVLDEIPEDDPETANTIRSGQTIGCFQIESPGMRATLREIQASTPQDLIAALALYRPGPLKGGLKDTFVRRYLGKEPVTHLHSDLSPILDETFGIILFQEQVLRIANEIAGFSLAEADLLRRAMSHFDPGKQMLTLKNRFIDNAWKIRQIDPQTAIRIWELMAAFAGYGFPKAHAASYAQIAWRAAWCKTHYPAEFMGAVLANWGGYYSQRVYLSEARRMGLVVKPPHINHSEREFKVAYPQGERILYMGLDQVRDLTRRTQRLIIAKRPFHTLDEFLLRADPSPQEAINLIKAGSLEGLGRVPAMLQYVTNLQWSSGQPGLFDHFVDGGVERSLPEIISDQESILGLSVDAHPLAQYSKIIKDSGVLSTSDAAQHIGQSVIVAGIKQAYRRHFTKNGATMAFLSLEDGDGMINVIIFPNLYQNIKDILTNHSAYLVEGSVEPDASTGDPEIVATHIEPLTTNEHG